MYMSTADENKSIRHIMPSVLIFMTPILGTKYREEGTSKRQRNIEKIHFYIM